MSLSPVRASAQEPIVTREILIDGRWRSASDGRTLDVVQTLYTLNSVQCGQHLTLVQM